MQQARARSVCSTAPALRGGAHGTAPALRGGAHGTAALLALAVLSACAAPRAAAPSAARPLPEPMSEAKRVLDGFGRKLYAAVADGKPADVLFDDAALRVLLTPASASRLALLRAAPPTVAPLPVDARALLRSAQYAGLCVQQGRLEPQGGALGLRAPGFLFERALLIGRDAGGGTVATWVEGDFLHTDAGFGALSLESVEAPRRDHADLELADCELRTGR